MSNKMTIENAKYAEYAGEKISITATIDGVILYVPLSPSNRHYAEIMRQVEAGELTIEPADSE